MIDTQNKIWSKIIQREKQNYQEKKKMLKNDRIALIVNQEGNLNEFFRKKVRGNQDVALPVRLFSNVFGFITSAPAHVVREVEKINERYIATRKATQVTKVRPPRFVSFRMELEPYNEQKALALQ